MPQLCFNTNDIDFKKTLSGKGGEKKAGFPSLSVDNHKETVYLGTPSGAYAYERDPLSF